MQTLYRKNEHGLQAAETISTIASLSSGFTYPTQALYEAWILMLLNMDRNTLWGSAAGFVYESENSWDVRDRMEYVEASNKKVDAEALSAITPGGDGVAVFNPLNWDRHDPVTMELPEGKSPEGVVCQTTADGKTLCALRLPSVGVAGIALTSKRPETPSKVSLAEQIETAHYTARIDSKTGALASLKLKPSGRELLGGPANVIVAEKPKPQKEDYGDFMSPRPERTRLASSSDFKPTITVDNGPLAMTVEVTSEFYGGAASRRSMRFYKDFPRVDFETDLQDIPNITVVVAEFPLAEDIEEVRRSIPCGFSHGARAKPNPNLVGWTKGITPAVRWTHYSLAGGGGVAILDRGLTGRELNGKTPIIYLLNATDTYYKYPNAWLSGKGKHHLEYAQVVHGEKWEQARIPQTAWEYNCPPVLVTGRKVMAAKSFLRTSSNVIVEVLRREGKDIEMRMTECLGSAGTAEVTLNLPHRGAALTNLRGGNPKPLGEAALLIAFPYGHSRL